MNKASRSDDLKLAAKFLLQIMYDPTYDWSKFSGSADYCNIWSLLQEGLGNPDLHPQVSLTAIREYIENKLK